MWLRRRLELCGMRSVNNVVDATNYVMLELGQPLHAFDMDRVADKTIVVRAAGEDREFATLDDIKRTLGATDLMIADREKPLAIAGVMGGQNSEVSASTTSLILESAYFEPMTIARTARRLGLRSEASYRFERGIDRSGQVRPLARRGTDSPNRGRPRSRSDGRRRARPSQTARDRCRPRAIGSMLGRLTRDGDQAAAQSGRHGSVREWPQSIEGAAAAVPSRYQRDCGRRRRNRPAGWPCRNSRAMPRARC